MLWSADCHAHSSISNGQMRRWGDSTQWPSLRLSWDFFGGLGARLETVVVAVSTFNVKRWNMSNRLILAVSQHCTTCPDEAESRQKRDEQSICSRPAYCLLCYEMTQLVSALALPPSSSSYKDGLYYKSVTNYQHCGPIFQTAPIASFEYSYSFRDLQYA